MFFGGLVLTILHLQTTGWFKTGYSVVESIHPEATLRLSWPFPNQLKYPIPLATGSYCWWPCAPALGVAGLVRALGGRERRVSFMMVVSALTLIGFFYIGEAFPLWMAFVNGGGLILGGLWMRRI